MEIYCCASDEIFKIVPTTNEDGIWTTDSASDLNNTSEPQHPTIVVASDVNVEQKHKIRSAKEACDFYKTNKIDLIIDHILGGDGVRINLYPHMVNTFLPNWNYSYIEIFFLKIFYFSVFLKKF